MCLSPVHIFPRPLHFRAALSCGSIDVPCGKCEACRDARKVSWEDRLCLEVADWYKHGGIGLLLTFTYNETFLPRYCTDTASVPCFSPSDVKQFLNRLKVRCYREFGPNFYKYFICSEFGKITQRPHLHSTFLIADGTKYVQFVEICRECWSLTFETDRKGHKRLVHRLGYMFPKRKHGIYVDDKGRNRDPRFRNQLAGAKYVCKYVCKDLAYMDDERVKDMMREPYFSYYLPKSYKSNNLGFGPIERILESGDTAKIQLMLKNGIWSPLQCKYIPLWQSAISRLMYNNVNNGRTNVMTGKPLYDRELSDFGRLFLWYTFKCRYERTILKMYERMLLYVSSDVLQKQFEFSFPKLFLQSDFRKYALYHCLLRTLQCEQFGSQYAYFRAFGKSFFDVDSWREFYLLRHSNADLRHIDYPLLNADFPHFDIIEDCKRFDVFYSSLCRYLEEQNLKEYANRGIAIEKAKRATGVYGFDETLC